MPVSPTLVGSDSMKRVVMNEEDPSSVQAHEKREKARAEKAARMSTAEEASEVFLKSKQDQLGYLIQLKWERLAPASHLMQQVHVSRWNLFHVSMRVRSVRAASSHNAVKTR